MIPETDLEITRLLKAPPAKVWRCFAEAALLAQWWAPRPATISAAGIDLAAGGRFHATMHIPDYGIQQLELCVLQAVPQARLVFTDMMQTGFRPAPPMFGFTAVLTMQAEGQGTRYRALVMHRSAEVAAQHRDMGFYEGWGTCITQLDDLSQGL